MKKLEPIKKFLTEHPGAMSEEKKRAINDKFLELSMLLAPYANMSDYKQAHERLMESMMWFDKACDGYKNIQELMEECGSEGRP